MPTYVARHPHDRAGLRQHRHDRCTCTPRSCASSTRSAPTRRSAATSREVVEHGQLFGSWGSEPAVSLSRTLPDGDGGPRRRRRLRRRRREVLLHDGARRLALHGLVRARRRDRHGQGPAPGAGPRRRAGHRHRRQVGHARHARAPTARRSRFTGVRVPARCRARPIRARPPRSASSRASRSATPPSTSASRRRPSPSRVDYAKKRIVKPENIAGGPRSRPCSATSASCRAAPRRRPAGARRLRADWDARRRDRARHPRQPRQVPRHRGRPRGHVQGHPDRRAAAAPTGLSRRSARFRDVRTVDADAADDGPHARGDRQERARPHRGHVHA